MSYAWSLTSISQSNSWSSVAYGTDTSVNGIFVAVSVNGSGNQIMTSRNGTSWTTQSSPVVKTWMSVVYGMGLFVAVGFSDVVMTSSDGINWTTSSCPGGSWMSVVLGQDPSGNSMFVAVGKSGKLSMKSYDGLNWTSHTITATNTNHYSVAYGTDASGNKIFVAVTIDNTFVSISYDGAESWTQQTLPGAIQLDYSSITYGNGLFVAVARRFGSDQKVIYSNNGLTWTRAPETMTGYWNAITFGDGMFVAISNINSPGNRVMASVNGSTWTDVSSAFTYAWYAVCYGYDPSGNGIFVSVPNTVTQTLGLSVGAVMTAPRTAPVAPTIGSLVLPSNKKYTDSPFTLTDPSSNSTGTFSYTSSNTSVATISGNTLTITGAGSSTITAIQAAASGFITGSTSSTFTASKADPTITGFTLPTDKVYGDNPFTLTPPSSNSSGTFSYTSSNTNVATVSGTTVSIVGAGLTTIHANQASTANFNSGSVSSDMTIGKGTPILVMTIAQKTVEDPPFTPTLSASLLIGGAVIFESSDHSIATISGDLVVIQGQVGSSNITATLVETDNYYSATTDASLNVIQLFPTITNFSLPTDKVEGDAPFDIADPSSNSVGTFSYTSSDHLVATIIGNTLTIHRAGSTTISAHQGISAPYSASSVSTVFEVFKATADRPATITDDSSLTFFLNSPAIYGAIENSIESVSGVLLSSTKKRLQTDLVDVKITKI